VREVRADDLFLFIFEAFGEGVGMAFECARRGAAPQPHIHADVRVSGKRLGDIGYGNPGFLRDVMDSGLFMVHRDDEERSGRGPSDPCFSGSIRLRYRTRKITYKKKFSLSTVFFYVFLIRTY
jgi:hypothetical protein